MNIRKTVNDKMKQNVIVYGLVLVTLCAVPGLLINLYATGQFDIVFFISCFLTFFFSGLSFLPLLGKDGDDLLIGSAALFATGATLWVIKYLMSRMELDWAGVLASGALLGGLGGLFLYWKPRQGESWKDAVAVVSTIMGVLSAIGIGVSTL